MRKVLYLILYVIFCAVAVPLIVLSFSGDAAESFDMSAARAPSEKTVTVYFADSGDVRTMPIEEYLVGVVCAEMPASFETEALKAQAVAARSYALYKIEHPSSDSPHPDADVCTDYTHCKAYKDKETAFADWGGDAESYYAKISSAVDATAGEIISYGGETALAVFHASSGGHTENASDVWGGDYPYLVGVDSPGEEYYSQYHSTVTVPFAEFAEVLAGEGASVASPDDISDPILSGGGRVKSVIIGGMSFSGAKIRELFSLRSAMFDIDADEDGVTFNVTGYGHGVGMSQYGANAMALAGSDYADILKHYYSGVEIVGAYGGI